MAKDNKEFITKAASDSPISDLPFNCHEEKTSPSEKTAKDWGQGLGFSAADQSAA